METKDKMMKKILMSALALGAITTGSYAACAGTVCGQVDVQRLYITDTGTIYIGTSGVETALNCTAPGDQYLSIRDADVGKNALYSMLLTAQTTKRKIDIGIEAGSADCHVLAIVVN